MKKFTIINFLLLISLLGFSQNKPNIIVILTDDQGWADVGFNGATDIQTPNLDRLASQGVIFNNAYVSHPYCSPSRAGLLTGRYQARFGHDCNIEEHAEDDITVGTPSSEILIPEALKEAGYKTSAIGKWHLGDHKDLHPTAQGFEHWFGFVAGGMNYWGTPSGSTRTILRNGQEVPQSELSYLTDDFTEEAIQFISQKKEDPFFIYLSYNAPHAPDQVTKMYLDQTAHIEYGGRSIYAAMVAAVDAGVGKIDSTLQAAGIKENTMIVFLSDNGGRVEHADNRPFRGHKGMLFEGGIKVPFFISWPAGITGNKHFQKPVSSLDLFPTFLESAGLSKENHPQLEGVSLLPFIKEEKQGYPHEKLFWRSVGGFEYAVRKGDYKLYKSAYKKKTLLFDLKNDPYERKDIAEEHMDLIIELEKAYAEWDAKNMDAQWLDPHPENVLKEADKYNRARSNAMRGEHN
ncbi:MAG: sulfatase-like hydrolase/transferase [Cytophagales bacterium]|nr:sulfatase-like hydrolase/transferase [Cytophagales bacterium]